MRFWTLASHQNDLKPEEKKWALPGEKKKQNHKPKPKTNLIAPVPRFLTPWAWGKGCWAAARGTGARAPSSFARRRLWAGEREGSGGCGQPSSVLRLSFPEGGERGPAGVFPPGCCRDTRRGRWVRRWRCSGGGRRPAAAPALEKQSPSAADGPPASDRGWWFREKPEARLPPVALCTRWRDPVSPFWRRRQSAEQRPPQRRLRVRSRGGNRHLRCDPPRENDLLFEDGIYGGGGHSTSSPVGFAGHRAPRARGGPARLGRAGLGSVGLGWARFRARPSAPHRSLASPPTGSAPLATGGAHPLGQPIKLPPASRARGGRGLIKTRGPPLCRRSDGGTASERPGRRRLLRPRGRAAERGCGVPGRDLLQRSL